MKQCRKCGVDLTSDNHYPSYTKASIYVCISCSKGYYKQRRTKDSVSEANSRPISRFRRLVASTKRRGHEVLISFKEFENLMNQPCTYCFNRLGGISKQGSNLDRIDNSKPYSIDNIQPCCKVCNNIRNNFLTVQETHVVVDALLKYRESQQ